MYIEECFGKVSDFEFLCWLFTESHGEYVIFPLNVPGYLNRNHLLCPVKNSADILSPQ